MKTVFKTEWFSLEALPCEEENGQPYYRLSSNDSVGILAVTSDQEIVLVRQYRPAIEEFAIEYPGGQVDDGESPAEAIAREFLEETGYSCGSIEYLGAFRLASSRLNNKAHVFFGRGAMCNGGGKEPGIEIILASEPRFQDLIRRGEFASISGIGLYYLCKLKGLL